MAVCNLFNYLDKDTGNFLMFSQYTEDLTRFAIENEAYKIEPSKFVVLDINYSKVETKLNELNIYNTNLNDDLPKYFQNYFENSCAYLRNNYKDENNNSIWYPGVSTNLFWKSLNNIDMISIQSDGDDKIIPEIRFIGDINMQSYDSKDGMGYGEIYCHIPTDSPSYKYYTDMFESKVIENPNTSLEGYPDISIGNYSTIYYPEKSIEIDMETTSINSTYKESYNFNTIVILYDIKIKNGEYEWVSVEENSNIPLGIYFAGKFNNTILSNPVTKYITNDDAYGMGTSYGLRICTRFSTTPQSKINIVDVKTNQGNYSAFCQVMSEMSETHNMMNKVISNIIQQSQDIKDALAIFKNNRVNVPYIREVNGVKFWFVNGKCMGIATTEGGGSCNCNPASIEDVQSTIDQYDTME